MSKQGQSVQSHHATGSVPFRNEKGEIAMQKVRVQRYVTGKAPKYHDPSLEEDSDDDEIEKRRNKLAPLPSRKEKPTSSIMFSSKASGSQMRGYTEEDRSGSEMEMSDEEDDNDTAVDPQLYSDPRMRRIMQNTQQASSSRGHSSRHRDSDDDDSDSDDRTRRRHREVIDEDAIVDESDDGEDDVQDRHDALKRRLQSSSHQYSDPRRHQVESDDDDDSDDEDDEEEDEEESEDEFAPRLKPVFVSKKDRITILEKEAEEERRIEQEEAEKKLQAEERRRQAKKLVEDERRREEEEEATAKAQGEEENLIRGIQSILTDDEDEETATELWKVRELRRLKRDKDEEDAREKEKDDVERMRNMTEEERLRELEKNPKKKTNEQEKGDYKYMQKYYHRGAFYLDQDDDVFKRNFAQPTLEDHFDKSSLPTVMQVKNFGLAGRTKYTHLTDQDTTAFDQGWGDKKNQNAKNFHNKHAAGMKQVDRPSKRRRDD